MNAVDEQLLELLGSTGLNVHDADVPTDPADPKIVTAELPYLVLWSSIGLDVVNRLTASPTRRTVTFQVTYVGETRLQAKAAGERARDVLNGARLNVPGRKAWRLKVTTSDRIRRDKDVHTTYGGPLYYGADQYEAAVTLPAPA